MNNTMWLLLQLIGDILVIWLCWVVYPYWCDFWYPKFSNEHDEHENADRARGRLWRFSRSAH